MSEILVHTDDVGGGSYFVPPTASLIVEASPPTRMSARLKPAAQPAAITGPSHTPHQTPIALTCGLRYDQLLAYIERHPSLSILEIGVARGAAAVRMMARADQLGGTARYAGIDLFGSLTPEQLAKSYCIEAKRPLSRGETMEMFRQQLGPDIALRMTLFEGRSDGVLPELIRQRFKYDLIFIDGDHSYEGVAGDWRMCQELLAEGGAAVFDDFPNWGVPGAIAEIDRTRWNIRILPQIDVFSNHRTDETSAPYRMHQLVEVTRRTP